MRKFVITSPRFQGTLTFWYNELDLLVHYDNDSDMSEAGHVRILQHLPLQSTSLKEIEIMTKGMLNELPPDISFDVFWEAYRVKEKKSRALPLWKKLSDADKMAAITSVKAYDRYLQRVSWRNKALPDKYLRERYFETNWNQNNN